MAKNSQIVPLTSFRFFAALFVVVCHNAIVWENSKIPILLDLKANGGKYGITFFFILSGYILAHRYKDGFANRESVKKYFQSRFARIIPLYWLCLILGVASFWVTTKLTGEPFPVSHIASDFLLKFTFLQAIWAPGNAKFPILQQGWTLSVEMAFYLIFPFLIEPIKRLSPRNRGFLVGFGILAHMVFTELQWRTVGFESSAFHFFAWFPLVHFPFFIIGMSIQLDAEAWRNLYREKVIRVCTLLLAILWILNGIDVHSYHGIGAVVWLMGFVIVYGIETKNRFLCSPKLEFLGNASYGLYLVHGLAAAVTPFLLKKLKIDSALNNYPYFVFSSLVAIVASCFLFIVFEQPMRKWINGFGGSRQVGRP